MPGRYAELAAVDLDARVWPHVDRAYDGCWEWPRPRNDGRPTISVDGRRMYIYRLVYNQVVGPVPIGFLVCHACDNPSCIRPDHLFLGTHQDNTSDMLKKGRGSTPPQGPKVTDVPAATIRQIREMYATGDFAQRELARMFAVDQASVSLWVLGRTRRDVAGPVVEKPVIPRGPLKPCGTWAAYARHRRRGEVPCEDCSEASRERGRRKRETERSGA